MHHLNVHPDIQADPVQILQTFKKLYSLDETKTRLAEWLEVAVTTDNMPYDDSKSREELYKFYHMLVDVTEAIWFLEKNH